MSPLGTAHRSTAVKQHNQHKIMNKGPFQDQPLKRVGNILQICQLNIEGISRDKSEYLTRILKDNAIDILVLQETHTLNDEDLLRRGKIAGFSVIAALHHRAYGLATYVKNGTEDVSVIECSDQNDVYTITIKIGNTYVVNVYKPPLIT